MPLPCEWVAMAVYPVAYCAGAGVGAHAADPPPSWKHLPPLPSEAGGVALFSLERYISLSLYSFCSSVLRGSKLGFVFVGP